MKSLLCKTWLLLLFLLYVYTAYTQVPGLDSVKKVLQTQKEDTNKVWTLIALVNYYMVARADTGIIYAHQALDLSQKLNFESGILYAGGKLAVSLTFAGNYLLGLDYAFKTLSLAKKKYPTARGWAYSLVSYSYYYLGEYNTCISYTREAMKIAQPDEIAFVWRDLSLVFHKLNKPDSAMLYAKKAYDQLKGTGAGNISNVLGDAYAAKGNYDSALILYRNGVPVAQRDYDEPELIDCYNNIAGVYKAINNLDSAAWYCKKVLDEKIEKSYPLGLFTTTNMLADIYESKNKPDSSL